AACWWSGSSRRRSTAASPRCVIASTSHRCRGGGMTHRRSLKVAGALVALAVAAWLLRSCYGVFVNKEDQPAADRIVAAADAYQKANGRYPATLGELVPKYLAALPTPRRFGSIGYAPLEG